MDRQDVESVLISYLYQYSLDKEIDVAYPNKVYEPVVNKEWLKVTFLQSKSSDTVLSSGYERLNGIMQININVPKDSGTYELYNISKELKEIFEPNSILRNGNNKVHLQNVYLEGENIEESWFTKYLTIEYSEFNN